MVSLCDLHAVNLLIARSGSKTTEESQNELLYNWWLILLQAAIISGRDLGGIAWLTKIWVISRDI